MAVTRHQFNSTSRMQGTLCGGLVDHTSRPYSGGNPCSEIYSDNYAYLGVGVWGRAGGPGGEVAWHEHDTIDQSGCQVPCSMVGSNILASHPPMNACQMGETHTTLPYWG